MKESSINDDRQNTRPGIALVAGLLILIGGAVMWLRPSTEPPPPDPPPSVRQVELADTYKTNDLTYVKGEAAPFNGQIVEHYRDGQRKSQTDISDGLLEGMSFGWFTNGTMQVEEPFQAGKAHGKRTKWRIDGTKLSEAEIVNGELHGVFRRWHENGELSQRVPMQNGKPHGESLAWHPNGNLKARVTLTNGVVVTQEFFDESGKAQSDKDAQPAQ